MDKKEILEILNLVRNSRLTPEEALNKFKLIPFLTLGNVVIDTHRELRAGMTEIIYGENKDLKTLTKAIKLVLKGSKRVMVTRLSREKAKSLKRKFPSLIYDATSNILHSFFPRAKTENYVSILTAGSSDFKIAREAEIVCRLMGVKTYTAFDVGIAGIHRLTPHMDKIVKSSCIIVVAGMEGALPGVIAGMVGIPVIGVPASTGYGAGSGGFSALLTMLNSCSPNIVVVNIDDGVGAGYTAALIALQGSR